METNASRVALQHLDRIRKDVAEISEHLRDELNVLNEAQPEMMTAIDRINLRLNRIDTRIDGLEATVRSLLKAA